MNDKLVFWCGTCGSKLVVHKHDAKKLPRIDVQQWYGEELGVVTADCFCGGMMTAYTNGADGAFVDDIRNIREEFERIIECAYDAAQAAVDNKRKH